MKLFGFALVSAQYIKALQIANEEMAVKNENQAGIINSLTAELATEKSAHNRALEAFNDMKASYNLMEDKFKGEVAILEHELQELRDQKAEIEQERMEAVNAIDDLNDDNGILIKEINELKQKVAQLNGRLGAYKKKFGDLPHRRENDRKRKAQKQNQPSEEKLEKTTY